MTNLHSQNCRVCRSVAGTERISPGPVIYEGKYWMVDHAYPTSHPGWLVIVLKRHAEALHELGKEEFLELGEIQFLAVQTVAREFSCQKEYIMLFAEQEGFNHQHFHVVPRPAELEQEFRGAKIFKKLDPGPETVLPAEVIIRISEKLAQEMSWIVDSRSGPTPT